MLLEEENRLQESTEGRQPQTTARGVVRGSHKQGPALVALDLKGGVACDEGVDLGDVAQRTGQGEVVQEARKRHRLVLEHRELPVHGLSAYVVGV